jgi:hypothetical protein
MIMIYIHIYIYDNLDLSDEIFAHDTSGETGSADADMLMLSSFGTTAGVIVIIVYRYRQRRH